MRNTGLLAALSIIVNFSSAVDLGKTYDLKPTRNNFPNIWDYRDNLSEASHKLEGLKLELATDIVSNLNFMEALAFHWFYNIAGSSAVTIRDRLNYIADYHDIDVSTPALE